MPKLSFLHKRTGFKSAPLSLFMALIVVSLFACSDKTSRTFGNLQRPEGGVVIPSSYERPARLYVSNPPSNVLSVYNLAAETATPIPAPVGFFPLEIPVGRFPRKLAATACGQYLLSLNELTRDISIVGVDDNIELDAFPASPASQSVEGVAARKNITRLAFEDGEGGFLRIGDILVERLDRPQETKPGEGQEKGYLTTKTLRSLIAVSLPDAGEVRTFIFDPATFWQGGAAFLELEKYNLEDFSPSLLRTSQNSEYLWAADEEEPRVARIQIRELPKTNNGRPPRLGDKDNGEPYLGRIDKVTLPGKVFDMETVPKRPYDGGSYPDRLYILDRENAYIYILTADTLKFKDPYPRRAEAGKPGISLGELAVTDLIMTDFYRPYYFTNTSGCEAQVAWVLSMSGNMFAIDIGGCYPFVEGASAEFARHKPHHLLDIDPKTPEVDKPVLVMPDGTLVTSPEETSPAILNGDDAENNYGIMVGDGQAFSQRFTVTYLGDIPPRYDAPGILSARADISGLIVSFTDEEIDLTQSGVKVGDLLKVKTISIVNAVNSSEAEEEEEIKKCPLIPIETINKRSIKLSALLPKQCQGKNLSVSLRVKEGWTVIGAYSGYLGRQHEDGIYRPFPDGASGYIAQFALKPQPEGATRQEGAKIVFNVNSNIALMRFSAAYTVEGTATIPMSSAAGRHYPGAPLMLYVIFAGSELVLPVNLEMHDLFSGYPLQ